MAEYWKSTPKYWCKHCSIYIRDTPFEKKQHESTAKHQGNLKRFLRDIQNNHEKDEREKQKAKSEVERLNKAFGSSTGSAGLPSTLRAATEKPAFKALSASDQKRQWSQLAGMGIEVPEDFRREVAMAGNWQKVSKTVVQEPLVQEENHTVGVHKRKLDETEDAAETLDEDLPQHPAKRKWGSSLKQYPGENNDDDLDALFSRTQPIEMNKQEDLELGCVKLETKEEDVTTQNNEDSSLVKLESRATESQDTARVKPEHDQAATEVTDSIPPTATLPIFKKRKAKAGFA